MLGNRKPSNSMAISRRDLVIGSAKFATLAALPTTIVFTTPNSAHANPAVIAGMQLALSLAGMLANSRNAGSANAIGIILGQILRNQELIQKSIEQISMNIDQLRRELDDQPIEILITKFSADSHQLLLDIKYFTELYEDQGDRFIDNNTDSNNYLNLIEKLQTLVGQSIFLSKSPLGTIQFISSLEIVKAVIVSLSQIINLFPTFPVEYKPSDAWFRTVANNLKESCEKLRSAPASISGEKNIVDQIAESTARSSELWTRLSEENLPPELVQLMAENLSLSNPNNSEVSVCLRVVETVIAPTWGGGCGRPDEILQANRTRPPKRVGQHENGIQDNRRRAQIADCVATMEPVEVVRGYRRANYLIEKQNVDPEGLTDLASNIASVSFNNSANGPVIDNCLEITLEWDANAYVEKINAWSDEEIRLRSLIFAELLLKEIIVKCDELASIY